MIEDAEVLAIADLPVKLRGVDFLVAAARDRA
jgi:hypothetical protein